MRSDLAWAQATIAPTRAKGTLGESFASKVYLRNALNHSGWHEVSPRSAPQGLDHVFIQTDNVGMLRDMLIAESKFGTSRLGNTKDGVQMGESWTNARMRKLAANYQKVSLLTPEVSQKCPLKPANAIDVILPGEKKVTFWQASKEGEWRFSGTKEDLPNAKKLAKQYGEYMSGAADGKISFRKRVFHIEPKGSDLAVSVYDAADLADSTAYKSAREVTSFTLKNAWSHDARMLRSSKDEIAKMIQGKTQGISDAEARAYAEEVIRHTSPNGLAKGYSLGKSLAKSSGIAGAIGGGLSLGMQALSGEGVSFAQIGSSAAILAGSSLVGSTAQIVSRNSTGIVKSLSGTLGGVGTASRFVGGGAALGAAFALIDAKAFFESNMTAYDFSQSVSLAICGPAASGVVFGLVAAYGTAGTGAAISTLSGAAAYNATMAAIGGGPLAVGGGGMLAGGLALGGVAVLATAAVYVCFRMYDKSQEEKRIQLKLEWLQDGANIRTAWKNH